MTEEEVKQKYFAWRRANDLEESAWDDYWKSSAALKEKLEMHPQDGSLEDIWIQEYYEHH